MKVSPMSCALESVVGNIKMYSVYIVEDDKHIREELAILLEHNAYKVYTTTAFDSLVDDIIAASPDIVLLDLGLPHVDGQVVCRALRECSDIPIIVVTSRDNDLDEFMSINLGADDYITKPYSTHILLARIATILRRANTTSSNAVLNYKGIELDTQRDLVSFEGKSTELTRNEIRILQVLMQSEGSIVARDMIQRELWQSDQFIDDNTLTVNVNRLRSTLELIGIDDLIQTKRGHGYYLK